jgi:hypothetical protein
MVLVGIGFVAIPNVLLPLFGFRETGEVWIRVVGFLALILAFYYIQAARNELTGFFQWSLYCRPSFFVFSIVVVVLGLAQPMLILFGVIDLLGAIWTGLDLRRSQGQAVHFLLPGSFPLTSCQVSKPRRVG